MAEVKEQTRKVDVGGASKGRRQPLRKREKEDHEGVGLEEEEIATKAIHPVTVVSAKSYITRKRRGARTHYITIPYRLTTQAGYLFEPGEEVEIELDIENQVLTVKRRRL